MNARRQRKNFRMESQNLPEVRRAIQGRGNSREMFKKYQEEYSKMTEEEREALRDLWMKRAGMTNEEFANRAEIIRKRTRAKPYEHL